MKPLFIFLINKLNMKSLNISSHFYTRVFDYARVFETLDPLLTFLEPYFLVNDSSLYSDS